MLHLCDVKVGFFSEGGWWLLKKKKDAATETTTKELSSNTIFHAFLLSPENAKMNKTGLLSIRNSAQCRDYAIKLYNIQGKQIKAHETFETAVVRRR